MTRNASKVVLIIQASDHGGKFYFLTEIQNCQQTYCCFQQSGFRPVVMAIHDTDDNNITKHTCNLKCITVLQLCRIILELTAL